MKNLIKITAIIFAIAMVVVACDKKQNEVNPIENNIEPNPSGVIKAPAPAVMGYEVYENGVFIKCLYDRAENCLPEVEIFGIALHRGLIAKLDDIIINNPSAISEFFSENDDWKAIFPQLEVTFPNYLDLLKSRFLTMKRHEGTNGMVYYGIYTVLVSINDSEPKCLATFPVKVNN